MNRENTEFTPPHERERVQPKQPMQRLRNLCAKIATSSMIAVGVICAATMASTAAHAAIPTAERQALLDIYAQTNGANWTGVSPAWTGAVGTECNWGGVTCDGAQRTVTHIVLSGKNLRGALPTSLGQLRNLQQFVASNNRLTVDIPTLTSLTSLRELHLGSNRLSGSIPALAGLLNLRIINLSRNNLTGSIPPLAGMSQLESLDVSTNQLTGTIPELTGLTSLGSLVVSYNRLTGAAPDVLRPNNLWPAQSALCANLLDDRIDEAWNTATGLSSWSTPCLRYMTVTPVTVPNGSIFPSTPRLVGYGGSITFDLDPDAGYGAAVNSDCRNGTYRGTSYVVELPDLEFSPQPSPQPIVDCTVTPIFSNARLNATISSTGPGSVTPVGVQNVLFGSLLTLTVIPLPGYRPVTQSNCAATRYFTTVGIQWTSAEPMQSDCTINIAFTTEFVVTPVAGANGGIYPGVPQRRLLGESITFAVLPDVGYRVASVNGCNARFTETFGRYSSYRIDAIAADCAFSASFESLAEVAARPVPVGGRYTSLVLLLLLAMTGIAPLMTRREHSR